MIVTIFLTVSFSLMKSMEKEEQSKIELWAEATRQLGSNFEDSDLENEKIKTNYVSLLLKVIQNNTSIPVVIVDDKEQYLWSQNFNFSSSDSTKYILNKIKNLKQKNNVIEIVIDNNTKQYLYYDDSILLKRLSYYPYLQLVILFLFILIAFLAYSSIKKSEQNKVWVGLSKETAHQLGTPISSLMAWLEILKSNNIDKDTLAEMSKDINRLKTITDRFSKIGSDPHLKKEDITIVTQEAVSYMKKRIGKRIVFNYHIPDDSIYCNLSVPLYQWVIENLCKNSVDAMSKDGNIDIYIKEHGKNSVITICDNGRGIPKKNFNTIFNPGFTTKQRGWGLGLTLCKRIIEEYHKGRIYVKESEPNTKTIIIIEIPLAETKPWTNNNQLL
ncbi:MAG: HAMP domain-containing sensor histidine kinase [Bacteroidales bacterium]|nr:HAMP domain-containing sensor histidine kinase [Bacteroidales bacterium]